MSSPETSTIPLISDDETNVIRIEDLHKSFGEHEVLRGINANVKTGEVVCIIGPSGSGKSTLLRCISRLESITSGNIWLGGFNLSDEKIDLNEVRKHVGMVFQHFNLFPNMTVAENITLAPTQVKNMLKNEHAQKLWNYYAALVSKKKLTHDQHPCRADRNSVWPSPGLWR